MSLKHEFLMPKLAIAAVSGRLIKFNSGPPPTSKYFLNITPIGKPLVSERLVQNRRKQVTFHFGVGLNMSVWVIQFW